MMSVIMRARSEQALARACDLGVAMQLTNIARDVGEDARCGRLYLPLQWMREVGLDPDAWLASPVFDERIAGVVRRLLKAADMLYSRAAHGVALLPRDCRPAICAAGLVYAEIGRELERAGLDSVNTRAVVSGRRKLVLLALASRAALISPADPTLQMPALAATQFLVDAAVNLEQGYQWAAPRRTLDDRTRLLAELFVRLEVRDRQDACASLRDSPSFGR
jgi:phytoene synthase